MFCQACGNPVAGPGTFCSRCGLRADGAMSVAGALPPRMMAPPRVERHVQTLGILWCVYGVYRLAAGLMGMFFLNAMWMRHFGGWGPWGMSGFGPHWMGALVPLIAVFTTVVTLLSLLVGVSLLTRRHWGRTLAIIAGILLLIRPLTGTALGVYTLWVLAPASSAIEYDAIADGGGL